MTELDKALEIFQQDRNDPKNQSHFYHLFLNATFCVPTVGSHTEAGEVEGEEAGHVVPLIIEAEGKDYLMLFDTEERLRNWAQEEVSFVEVPGHVLAATAVQGLYWALNIGAENSKLFQPEEIAWLKEAVDRCNAEAGGNGDEDSRL